MKNVTPDYAQAFSCIAGRCRHSCCIGWEIDIDGDTLARYRAFPGPFGDRLRQNITEEDGCACFKLTVPEERCPFLNGEGLCDIILTLGEDALCQICTDHPRFRSFFSDRVETCPGLCCEEAVRLLLGSPSPIRLIPEDDGGPAAPLTPWEAHLLSVRDALLDTAQDASSPLRDRCERILLSAGYPRTAETFTDGASMRRFLSFLMTLEQLDPAWGGLLSRMEAAEVSDPFGEGDRDRLGEKVLWYFLFRHLPTAEDASGLAVRAAFAVRMCALFLCLVRTTDAVSVPDAAERARMLSSEIEYSEDNTEAILEYLFTAFP